MECVVSHNVDWTLTDVASSSLCASIPFIRNDEGSYHTPQTLQINAISTVESTPFWITVHNSNSSLLGNVTLSIVSSARTVEIYSDRDGKDYHSTVRGVIDADLYLITVNISAASAFRIKFLSLKDLTKKTLLIRSVFLTAKASKVPRTCSSSLSQGDAQSTSFSLPALSQAVSEMMLTHLDPVMVRLEALEMSLLALSRESQKLRQNKAQILTVDTLLLDCRRLFLSEYEVFVNIGVYDSEKISAQRVVMNIDLYIPLLICTPEEDLLDEVVDYDFIRDTISSRVTQGHIQLQETFCDDILNCLMLHPKVSAARVSSRKADVYPNCKGVGVEVFRVK